MSILNRHSEVYWTWFDSLGEEQQSAIYNLDSDDEARAYAALLISQDCSKYLRQDSVAPFIEDVDKIDGARLQPNTNIYEITTTDGIKYAVGYDSEVEAEEAYLLNNSLEGYEGISDLTEVLQALMVERTDAATLVHVKGNLCRNAGKFTPCDGGAGKAAKEKDRAEKKARPKQVTDRTTIADLRAIANKHGIEHPTNGKRRAPWIEAIKNHPEGDQYFGGKTKPTPTAETKKTETKKPKVEKPKPEEKVSPFAEQESKTTRNDHKQIQSLGLALTKQHIDKSVFDKNEKDLFDAKIKAGEDLTKAVQGKASMAVIGKLQDHFFKIEQQHYHAIDQREQKEIAQFQGLRDGLIAHHNMDKKAISDEVDQFFFDPKIREKPELYDDVKKEINDFYAISGGKGMNTLGSVAKDTDRAYASWLGDGVMNIGESNGNPARFKGTIKHELGHHIDFGDPEIAQAGSKWRDSKATSLKPKKLKDITGIKEFEDDEIAVVGKYIDAYVGKLNGSEGVERSSEVTSMGVERFADARSMKKFYDKDPDHFNFALGVLMLKSKEPKRDRLSFEDMEI